MASDSGKYLRDGKVYRATDGKQCCESDGCFNLCVGGDLCEKHNKSVRTRTDICGEEGCVTRGSYVKTGTNRVWCTKHKPVGSQPRSSVLCSEEGCVTRGSYVKDGLKGSWCGKHKPDGSRFRSGKCNAEDCNTKGSYKKEGIVGLWCMKHKPPGSEVAFCLCSVDGCKQRGQYVAKGETLRWCATHKPPYAVLKHMSCESDGCEGKALYKEDGVARWCREHKPLGSVSKGKIKCVQDGCSTYAYYGDETTRWKRKYCASHGKEKGMMPIEVVKCTISGCRRRGSYTDKVSSNRFCIVHKADGMTARDIIRCKYLGCTKSAGYGEKGGRKVSCAEHRGPTMIKLSATRKCSECDVYPRYNYPEKKIGVCCLNHKKDGMVNVTSSNTKCEIEGCPKVASFGMIGQKCTRCKEHIMIGMIHKGTTNCTCKEDGCKSGSLFGYPGKMAEYCRKHHKGGMIAYPRKRCIVPGCSQLAIYGFDRQVHCELHADKGEVNILERKCKACGLPGFLNSEGMCDICDPSIIEFAKHVKQDIVERYLLANGYQPASIDKIIDGGACGKERPDFLFFGDGWAVIVEVDENQHSERACECEQSRMVNIFNSLAMPTFFIRYNPDEYKIPKGRKRLEHVPTSIRLKKLGEWIDYGLESNPEERGNSIEVMYLFYDGYTLKDRPATLLKKE